MSIIHTLRFAWKPGTDNAIDQTVSVTSDGEHNHEISAVGSGTNGGLTEIAEVFDIADLKAIVILADGALTLKTNSSSAPDDTIAIAASSPFVWYATSGIANPFSADVTSLFFLNGSATAVNVKIRILKDTTP